MRKSNSKIASLILALVMLASLFVVPAQASSEVNEITGLIWNVNSIEGIKLANAVENAANVQTMFAIYERGELASIISAQPEQGNNCVYFPSALNLSSGQTAKAFLWSTANIEPICKSYFVSAEGEVFSSCEIKGASKIVLPSDKADYRTKHEYALFDNELCENVKASFTISGNTTGLTMLADGTLIATPEATPGTISVTAQYGFKTYSKEVTIVDGYYNDFEGETVNTLPASLTMENATAGNAYVTSAAEGGNTGKYLTMPFGSRVQHSISEVNDGVVTIEFDMLRIPASTSSSRQDRQVLMLGTATKVSNSTESTYFDIRMRSKTTKKDDIVIYMQKDGTSAYEAFIGESNESKWMNIKVVLDYTNKVYDIYADGELKKEEYAFQTDFSNFCLDNIITGVPIDNINIYSGEAYEPYEVSGYDTIVLPGDDADFTTSIAYSLVDTDTEASVGGVTYAISGDIAGLSIDTNGNFIATNAAQAGVITVSATKNGKTYTKDVTTIKGYSTDFEDVDLGGFPQGWSRNKATSKVVSNDGNKYIERTEGYAAYTMSRFEGESVTVEFDTLLYKPVTNETLPYFMSRLNESGTSEQYFFIGLRDVKQGDIVTEIGLHTNYFDENGDTISDRNFVKYVPNNGGSFNTKYVINYVDKTYDLYIDNELILDDYAFPKVGSDYALETIRFRTCIDNVNIYTGTKNGD